MVLSSMTGFARSQGASGPYTFEWELKSVNAKGFDLRLRLPQGWDELEAFAKKRAAEMLSRGTIYANFNVKRADALSTVRINEDVLAAVVKAASSLAGRIDAVAPSIDGLLAIKGVIEVVEAERHFVLRALEVHDIWVNTLFCLVHVADELCNALRELKILLFSGALIFERDL